MTSRLTVWNTLNLANNGYTFAANLITEERRHADRLVEMGKIVKAMFPGPNGHKVVTYFTIASAAHYIDHLMKGYRIA